MPANKKYLTASAWERILKISAGFIGGYIVMISFHLFLTQWIDKKYIIPTSTFSGYILWCFLLLFALLAKKGWKVWLTYLLLAALFLLPILLNQ